MGFPSGGSDAKESACSAGDSGLIPGSVRKIPLEKGMAIYSSILAWRIPWTEAEGIIMMMMMILISGLNELVFISYFESMPGLQ